MGFIAVSGKVKPQTEICKTPNSEQALILILNVKNIPKKNTAKACDAKIHNQPAQMILIMLTLSGKP